MLGRKSRAQLDLFITGSLEKLVPEEHILACVNRVLDLGWRTLSLLSATPLLRRSRPVSSELGFLVHAPAGALDPTLLCQRTTTCLR